MCGMGLETTIEDSMAVITFDKFRHWPLFWCNNVVRVMSIGETLNSAAAERGLYQAPLR
jgi:hypothetical protein